MLETHAAECAALMRDFVSRAELRDATERLSP